VRVSGVARRAVLGVALLAVTGWIAGSAAAPPAAAEAATTPAAAQAATTPATAQAATTPATAKPAATTIRLGYLGSDTRALPDGAVVTACPRGDAPDLVGLTCDDGEITFTATDYDRGLGTQRIVVAYTVGGAAKSIAYRVSLEAPALTVPATNRYRYPLPQGTPTTVPYTTFRYSCQACEGASPQFRSASVRPARAGTARFGGTGLVFTPAPDFSGTATLRYRLRDRFGQQSSFASVAVTVVDGQSHAPTMVPTAVATTTTGGVTRATGDAMAKDLPERKHPATLTSCGTPFHGRVVCRADGTFVYTPIAGFTGVDEFGYHVFTKSTGDQAVGTVLVSVGGDTAARARMTAQLTAEPLAEKTPILTPLPFREGS
jgi:hypothetical protein